MQPIKEALEKAVKEAVRKSRDGAPFSSGAGDWFEVPREEKFGDLSTHVALKLAKEIKKPPRAVAEDIRKNLNESLNSPGLKGRISRVEVEGPGFLNFYYSSREIAGIVPKIKEEGGNFGKPKGILKKNILLEFVSANPTGPLTIAHGRQAALGDSLARILQFCGHAVTKEYYNNDEGVQIETLGKSTHLRVREILTGRKLEIPEDFYKGEYLLETAEKLLKEKKALLEKMDEAQQIALCTEFAKDDILGGIRKDLEDFDVTFDNYYSQKELGKSGKVEKTLGELKKKKVVYEKDGACWFRSTDLGDDKDRVLIKSDKTYTYLTPDIAYHHEKFQRGFDELINIWGPDHHGYIPRLKASQAALGHDPQRIRILIAQLVTLYEGEKQVRMSTRAGEFVTLREVVDEAGRDAGRFFFLMRKFDAHLDFDLELAKSRTVDNPVFYIQYAHARIESIKNLCVERNVKADWDETECLALLSSGPEIRLMRLLSQYEATVLAAAETLEPFRLIPYLQDLAGAFHRFYTDFRVVTDDASLTQARFMLVLAIQSVLKSGLSLLGVSAPLKM